MNTRNMRREGLARQRPLIAQLTLEEKVHLLTGETAFTLPGNDRIGLAPLAFSDGPTGVRGLKFAGGEAVALFPNATLISGSWDDAIAEEVGGMLADEAHRQGIHVVLGPTINLHRSPLGGRLFEAYSEDPYLTGRSAAAYVRGMQERGVAACLKHLVANESETLRNFVDSRVSEKALREVYLLPFEMAVQDADAWSMMAAYNDINGTTATEHAEIQQRIVKDEWDWDGLIMSDWFAVKRTVPSANAGLDLIMPGPDGPWGDRLVAAVRRGEVAEATVDDHLDRLLLLAERTGALEASGTGERDDEADLPLPDSAERREQLRRIAIRGMVLVKNEGGLLPWDGAGPVVLAGRHAVDTQGMGGGSAHVNPPHLTSVADALRARLGDRVGVVDGVEVRTRPLPAELGFVTDPVTGEDGMRVTFFAADGREIATRHEPGTTITVGFDDDFEEKPTAVEVTVRLRNHDGPVRVGGIANGVLTLTAENGKVIRREMPITTVEPAEAMLRPPSFVETLDLPAGALLTLRLEIERVNWEALFAANPQLDIAEESHLLVTGTFGTVALVAEQRTRTDDDALAEAEAAARDAGTAIVVVGLTDEDETEAHDKQTLVLPGRQDELVRRVAAAAERTIVVVNAATPVLMPWIDDVDAVLIAGLPGQEAGDAIADVLLGVAEPTGRLVTSYPRADGATPAWEVTPDENLAVTYSEGVAIGYRGYFDGLAPEPLFWFGHGLGYGTWGYANARVLPGEAEAPIVRVDVTNTGERASHEVVQVYFRPADPAQPIRLAGYAGVDVEPGRTSVVTIICDDGLFRSWDEGTHGWVRLTEGDLLIARGLGDIRARLRTS
ncbi:MAG: glycoside hydrolase family 3 C-terminal domain-containing protein [Propioniciclava sp.]|uniref:beta-glucosidase n=1 Tax=Propioniciclava sp. TaxID=2038686 RepID=UPI0039E4C8F5